MPDNPDMGNPAFPGFEPRPKLEGLNCFGQDRPLRFADPQMYVFGHHDIAEDAEVVAGADCFE